MLPLLSLANLSNSIARCVSYCGFEQLVSISGFVPFIGGINT